MTCFLLAAAWLVVSTAVAALLGGAIRLADRRAAEERLLAFLEADLRGEASMPTADGPRTSAAG